jgi:2-polyprenyl-3-methyl-5-hydroxy-6-metoxy-1,4-benzoquinol methylase
VIEGTQGYEQEAPELLRRYEAMSFADAHRGAVFELIPPPGIRVLDIGAGTGRDAAWFAARGDAVTAIEPTRVMREGAMMLHPEPNITWIDDSLPSLHSVREQTFDLIWMSAVWMHFDQGDRARMMPTVAALVTPGGTLMISLRHGPAPKGRQMFEVSAEETQSLARAAGLDCLRTDHIESPYTPGVSWDRLWFKH